MPFGLSFGASKGRSTQNVSTTGNETTNRSGTTNNNSTQTTSGSTQNWGSNDSFSNSSSTSAGTQSTTGNTVGTETQTTKLFSDDVLAGLEGLVGNLFSSSSNLSAGQNPSNFDPESFVRQAMMKAKASTQTSLDEATGGIYDAVGGRNNSASALLTQRLNNDATSSLAGTEASLTAQAEEIARNNLLAGNATATAQSDILTNVLASLRGGVTSTTGQQTQATAQNTATNQSESNAATGGERTSSLSETNTVESLISVISELLNQNTATNGQAYTSGTQSKMGGGASVSF